MTKISALVPTFNNQSSLRQVLEGLKWVDEIVVVDSFSTDQTLEIAKSFGAKIIQHEYINSAKQKNWAVPQCAHEWVLQIDTDEYLEADAEQKIRKAIASASEEVHCFKMARRNHILGKWVRHGGIYPDWEHRLFRREHGRWFDREVHANVRVSGKVEILDTDLIHYGMPNLSKQLKNLDRYTRYEADELRKKGKKFSYINWLLKPWLIFAYKYFYLKGFLDGWRGFFMAAYSAFYSWLSWAKLKEMEELNLDKSPVAK